LNRARSRRELIAAISLSICLAVERAKAMSIPPESWRVVVKLNAPSSVRLVGCRIGTAAHWKSRSAST